MRRFRVGALCAFLLVMAQVCSAGPNDEAAAAGRDTMRMLPSGALTWDDGTAGAESKWTIREPGVKDMLLSLALPGLGELRTGHEKRAVIHFAAEAAVWTTFIVYRLQGGLRKDDYIEYAEVYAGVEDGDGQSDGYYKNLASYMRSDPGPDSYNEIEVCRGKDIDTPKWRRVRCPRVPDMYQRFITSIKTGKNDQPDFARGAAIQKALDACVKSDREGRAIRL